MSEKIVIKGGRVIDPANGLDKITDLAIEDGKIAAGLEGATKIIDAQGKYVMPGLIDTHVHFAEGIEGYYMLTRAGVTTALDMLGHPEEIFNGLKNAPVGLNAAYLYPLLPFRTLSGENPDDNELREQIQYGLSKGALGVKIIGGHYPLTPDATRRAIAICADLKCWCAVHAGTTEHGSNIEGLEELVELADGNPLHIAHVNSYCRGHITGNPLQEALRALEALEKAPRSVSESYLDIINGASGRAIDGVPVSNVTKTCLSKGGFEVSVAGLEAAIKAGWAMVNGRRGNEIVLLSAEEGWKWYQQIDQDKLRLSFPVNAPVAQIAIASAKCSDNKFAVNALSTDGGNIPRNTTLKKGLLLVEFGVFTLEDFVRKACSNPACMLGVEQRKGHFGQGADADVIIVDPAEKLAKTVIAGGKITFSKGEFYPAPNNLISLNGNHVESGEQIHAVPSWLLT
jgi:hypothetical protein